MAEEEQQVKPGIRTTEFWLIVPAVLGALATGATEVLRDREEPWARALVLSAAVISAALAAAGYSVGRSQLKSRKK